MARRNFRGLVDVIRARKPARLPIVMARGEIRDAPFILSARCATIRNGRVGGQRFPCRPRMHPAVGDRRGLARWSLRRVLLMEDRLIPPQGRPPLGVVPGQSSPTLYMRVTEVLRA